MKILNSRDKKHIMQLLKEQFGFSADLDYVFLMNTNNRIYLANRSIEKIDMQKMRIDTLGLYFGELYNNALRLSIEGAQLIAKHAEKNIVPLNKEQMLEWVTGNDISCTEQHDGFVIVTWEKDVLGCGKTKNGTLFNYVSKSRKLAVVNI
ncbi:hypothetical protein C4573_05055 [Candidatus Woesearchaeota archaeon]|nr:MAG: hypothetical protein C4573_05055 [Candidatus Woesearchaeota archaeon]